MHIRRLLTRSPNVTQQSLVSIHPANSPQFIYVTGSHNEATFAAVWLLALPSTACK